MQVSGGMVPVVEDAFQVETVAAVGHEDGVVEVLPAVKAFL